MKIKPSSSSNAATDAGTLVNLTSEIARLQSLLQQASAENQAWSEKYGKLETEHTSLRETFAGIQQRLAWFEKQLFGQKSEKRALELGDNECPKSERTIYIGLTGGGRGLRSVHKIFP